MSYQIRVLDTDVEIPCREGETVLRALERAGYKDIIFGCFGGGCGQCLVHVVEGDYRSVKKMSRTHVSELDEQSGIVLSCAITPESDLVIVPKISLKL